MPVTTSTNANVVRFAKPWIEEDDIAAVAAVLRGTHLTQGPVTEAYEKAMAAYLGVKHAVAVSSGTAALHLAALIEGADEHTWGFVPPITFAATLNALWYCGVKNVVPVDVDPVTGNMTPETLEAAFERVPFWARGAKKIAIPVALQGRPLELPALAEVAARHGCTIIEDAAQAIAGTYTHEGKTFKCGSSAHTASAALSTHAVKQLVTGEGGVYTTNDDAKAARARLLRSHGISRPKNAPTYWYAEQVELGFHYRISDIQCALGLSQLPKLEARLAKRRAIAARYDAAFAEAFFAPHLQLMPRHEGHALHLYVVLLKDEATRNAAMEYCKAHGYSLKVNHEPLNHMPYHAARLKRVATPGAERYYSRCLTLALYPQMTGAEVEGQITVLRDFFKERA